MNPTLCTNKVDVFVRIIKLWVWCIATGATSLHGVGNVNSLFCMDTVLRSESGQIKNTTYIYLTLFESEHRLILWSESLIKALAQIWSWSPGTAQWLPAAPQRLVQCVNYCMCKDAGQTDEIKLKQQQRTNKDNVALKCRSFVTITFLYIIWFNADYID